MKKSFILKVGKHNKIQIEAGKRTNVQGGCQLNQVDQLTKEA